MTKTELTFLLSAIYVYERRSDAVSQMEVEAWYQLLANVDFQDAKHIITNHFATSDRPLTPVKILEGARTLNARRDPPDTVAEKTLVPDADPDDPAAFIQAIKEKRYMEERNPDDYPRRELDLTGVGRKVTDEAPELAPEKKPRPRRWWLPRSKGETDV